MDEFVVVHHLPPPPDPKLVGRQRKNSRQRIVQSSLCSLKGRWTRNCQGLRNCLPSQEFAMPNLDEFGREIPPPPRSARDAGGGGSTRRHHHHHESSSPHHHHHHRSSHHQESPRRGPSKKSSLQHPSLLYVSEPLLCEYVWKDQKEGRAATGAGENKNESDTENKNSDDMDDTTDNLSLIHI